MKLSLVFAAAIALGCSSTPEVACHAGADCASGICRSDGTCAPVETTDSGTNPDVTTEKDAATQDASKSDAPMTGCVPNNDGTITAAEAPLGPGLHAKFRVATNATISTA